MEVFGCDSFFLDSASLQAYVKEHDTFTRHGDISIGSLNVMGEMENFLEELEDGDMRKLKQ